MADTYPNFAALAAANTRGVDYEIAYRPTSGPGQLINIAIHGGAIRSATAQLAQYCAGAGGAYYAFSGIRATGNPALYMVATNFDEPAALSLVAASNFTVSWDGASASFPVTYVGGSDVYSAAMVRDALNAAGFPTAVPPTDMAGTEPGNICNRNVRRAGVQLSLSFQQRTAFFLGGDVSNAAVMLSANRTQSFYAYTNAVIDAMTAAMAPPVPGRPLPAPGAPTARQSGRSVQLAVPFSVGADGWLSVVQDEAQAVSDRVRALVGTLPGERVMRADYGVPTSEALFAPDADVAAAEVQLMVADAVTREEPSAVITSIVPTIDMDLGLVQVAVGVGRADVPQAELPRYKTIAVAVGGATTETAG